MKIKLFDIILVVVAFSITAAMYVYAHRHEDRCIEHECKVEVLH